MEIKPWFARVEFWTPVGAILAILLAQYFGVAMDVEAFVALVVMVVGIIWGSVSVENKFIEAQRDIYITETEKEMVRMRLFHEAKE